MEENKTGKNLSSGAKKVERIEKSTAKKPAQKTKKSELKTAVQKAKAEEAVAAEKRIQVAKAQAKEKEQKYLHKAELKQKQIEKRAELKQKRLEKRAALASKRAERKQARVERLAKLKEQRAEHKAERIARRELLKNESKAERQKRLEREKKERIALKKQKAEREAKAREQKLKAKEQARERRAREARHKREQRTERRKHAPGFGGWLAAVISLGVACLALATIVTAGAMRMNEMTVKNVGSGRATLYEFVSVSEDMDDNLSKLRASSGVNEQRKLVTEILIDTALMESALERMPVDTATGADISAFLNKTNSFCRRALNTLATGKALTKTERNTLNYLYEVNGTLYQALNEMSMCTAEKDFRAFLEGKECDFARKMGEISQGTLVEPKDTVDAPFANIGNVGENQLSKREEITSNRAEELVREYLQKYHVKEVVFTGETVAKSAECYNFTVKDENDVEMFAQITKKGGKLAYFACYEPCDDNNFSLEQCETLAKEYLASLGIKDVEAVWLSDAKNVADITFVSVQNGVRVYPETIRVRVCESKGRVVGMDAMSYLLNHTQRSFAKFVSREKAQEKLSPELQVYSAHLALIPVDGKEVLCHEFACSYGEEEYIVYLDANALDEVQVYRVRNSSRGSYLK